tara:strand:- start:2695 stop:3483 length:789 start_codon:yes stop_codon:yes gene_type:complete
LKIGIFDSGIGGLTVFKEISKALPSFEIIYLGDTARLPYGIKSKRTIDRYSINNVKLLKSLDCEIIVIACNTASSYSTNLLKSKFKIPIFDVISAGVKAALKDNPKILGVIGTDSTINSMAYNKMILNNNSNIKVYTKACSIFVPIIEQGLIKKKHYNKIIEENLKFFKNKNLNGLILGCTHYPIIKRKIKDYLGDDIRLIDSSLEVSATLKKYLEINYPNEFTKRKSKRSILLTDKSNYFDSVIKKIFNKLDFNIKLIDIK